MGQINCHCQYINNEDITSFKNYASTAPTAAQQSEVTHIYTKVVLKNSHRILDFPLYQSAKITYGTTEQCELKHDNYHGNSFKLLLKYKNRSFFIKDCGVGLGVFIQKKKIVVRAGAPNMLLNIGSTWISLKITQAQVISYTIYDQQRLYMGIFEQKDEHQIQFSNERLLLRRDKQGKQYTIRKSDRKQMWILLGEERKIKSKDIIRFGFQFFQVQSISSYLQASKIIKRH